MKIMLKHRFPPGVSSGLVSEIGKPPTLLSLAREGKLAHGGFCGCSANLRPMGTGIPPRSVMSGRMAHSTVEYRLRRGFEALLHPALISFLPPHFLVFLPF